jgi:molybdopterin/thiamine biosynthesis adenylyltransferase
MDPLARYRKQILFAGIQEEGQERIRQGRVLQIGCGALGCVVADHLTRAGVGLLRIVDRDFVEMSNLQRQSLFVEQDVRDHLPKAIIAARRLEQVNSDVTIEPHVVDVDYRNIHALADNVDLIIDGTDNFEIRYLINDLALELGIPWIFTGCTGSTGQVMPVIPGRSGCLRCLIPDAPPPGSTETCDTAGVLGPAIGMIASQEAAIALQILSGHSEQVPLQLTIIDVWDGTTRTMDVSGLRDNDQCPACKGERRFLDGSEASGAAVLCGRNAVQISPAENLSVSLEDLSQRLESVGSVTSNPFLTRVILEESGMEMSVFPDGRAIIRGTEDPAVARAIYSRYIGV